MTPQQPDPVLAADPDATALLHDQFTRVFLRRVGPEISSSFSAAQLGAIKRAFSARQIGTHPIDLRRTFDIFGFSFYIVFLSGRETRSPERRRLETSHASYLTGLALRSVVVCLVVFAFARIVLGSFTQAAGS